MILSRARGVAVRHPNLAHFKKFSSLSRNCLNSEVLSYGTIILSKRNNTQHRVILLPELPPDTPENNPILRTSQNELPNVATLTEANCYYGLGKALIQYESAVLKMEDDITKGEKDWEKLLVGLEESRVLLESVWNTVNLLNIVTDKLDMDRFTTLSKRAERAFLSRYDSRTIFGFLQSDAVENVQGEDLTLLKRYQLEYKNQGFELEEKKYLELNGNWIKRLMEATRDYKFKINAATQRFRHVIRDPNIVREFPVDLLKAMSVDSHQPAKGPWSVTLHPYIYRKFMEYCPDRRVRWNAHTALVSRGSRDMDTYLNVAGQVKDIRQHKLDQAVTIGYSTFAEMAMATKMAGSVENVTNMIQSMVGRARTAQEIELAALQEFAETRGFEDSIREFDVEFFKRKQIRSLYGIEEEAVRDYFPLPHVLKNVFGLMEEHYGLVFKLVDQSPDQKWVEELSVYQVEDKAGNIKGHCYLDPYIREDKGYQGGDNGWFIPLRSSSEVAGTKPLGCIVMALGTPGYGKPSLLSFNEVEELLRLFGKAVVHFAGTRKWAETSGRTGLEWDALNLVPDLMAHWLTVPHVLQALTCHWSTGEQLSDLQVENQIQANKHMAGYQICNELFKAAFDLSFFAEEYEKETYQSVADNLGLQYLVLSREREDAFPMYFEEMMAGNWSGGYYSHLWSKMLAADIFSAYWEAGWDDPKEIAKVSQKISSVLLASGSSKPMVQVFRELRGRDPNPEALMFSRGLSGSRSPKKRHHEAA